VYGFFCSFSRHTAHFFVQLQNQSGGLYSGLQLAAVGEQRCGLSFRSICSCAKNFLKKDQDARDETPVAEALPNHWLFAWPAPVVVSVGVSFWREHPQMPSAPY
jgi:hypothetical protein